MEGITSDLEPLGVLTAQRCQIYCHKHPMHLVDSVLEPFWPNTSCMDVKIGTLCIIWTLRGQIYDLDTSRLIKIDYIVLEKEGLGESLR